jgi:hypothetical protein
MLTAQAQQAVAQLDPDVLEQQMRAMMGKQIKQMEEAARRGPLPPGVASAEEFIDRFKQQMEQTLARMKQQFQQRQQAGPSALTVPDRGNESVTCLECSPDGRLVFVATDKGPPPLPTSQRLTKRCREGSRRFLRIGQGPATSWEDAGPCRWDPCGPGRGQAGRFRRDHPYPARLTRAAPARTSVPGSGLS